jgi:hypothetical protein
MNSYNPCLCCNAPACKTSGLSRRAFLGTVSVAPLVAAAAAPFVAAAARAAGDPDRQQPILTPLKIQPLLVYATPNRAEARSWRSWGAIQTEADATAERERIGRELKSLASSSPFPLDIRPPASAKTAAEAKKVAGGEHDVMLLYAAGGGTGVIEAALPKDRWNIMFLRHRSGPVYLWYEIAHNRFLRKTVDEYGDTGMDYDDVVVDSQADLRSRLRGLYAAKNTLGKRVVCVGGPSGWGTGGRKAAEFSRQIFKLDLVNVPYTEMGERIKRARANDALVKKTTALAEKYLSGKGVKLETKKQSVVNSFLLTEVFRDLLDENKTDAMTINQCMSTIMPMSETTACLPLSLLNDDGYMAFCESDFVVIPSGILLRYVSGNPVFLNDPTYPHHGVVTLAHCTAPRRMDGQHDEPVRLVTHFESDYGASPKVEMRKGQAVTTLDPDFNFKEWVGFDGEIEGSPFLPICRSQIDVAIKGNCASLVRDMKGFHWMIAYGSWLQEAGYALKKVGIKLKEV